ncbi:MAG: T9SS type A sorting domain-containing protein [Calditrichaeota bacterium]|nr:T9SS type A sorting domain-containing protein [Calditrichota bacterium]
MKFSRSFIVGIFCILSMANLVSAQTFREKVAQMLMVGFDNESNFFDTLIVDISERQLGGVLMFKHNLRSPEQIKQLTGQLQQGAQIPLLISTDEEGGRVARLNQTNGFAATYTPYQLGTIFNNEDTTRRTAAMMADWLLQSGINTNLAPVVDVNVNPHSPAIGKLQRSFSADPWTVFQHANWYIEEFQKRNVICTLKHFPGHGSATADSHLGFTDITDTWADSELVPYQQLCAAGFEGMVMVGHLYNAHLDSLYPATLSHKIITDLLREEIGFNGVVISDEMFMGAIVSYYQFDEAIELAINAGVDILLYATNKYQDQSLVRQVIDIVAQKVGEGKISPQRINESYERILRLKEELTSVKPEMAEAVIPENYHLTNFPNPFNNRTTISVATNHPEFISVAVYNAVGQLVTMICQHEMVAGARSFVWDATGFSTGIYFIAAKGEKLSATRKIILLR